MIQQLSILCPVDRLCQLPELACSSYYYKPVDRVDDPDPNEASCLRLVTAGVMEISEERVVGKRYLTLHDN